MSADADLSDQHVLSLDTEALAQTAYRAFTFAAGGKPRDWDGLALETMQPWGRLAKHAERLLEESQGRSWPDVARNLSDFANHEDAPLLPGQPDDPQHRAACWQALSRHLFQIIDEFDIPDLAALEMSWGPWAAHLLENQ